MQELEGENREVKTLEKIHRLCAFSDEQCVRKTHDCGTMYSDKEKCKECRSWRRRMKK